MTRKTGRSSDDFCRVKRVSKWWPNHRWLDFGNHAVYVIRHFVDKENIGITGFRSWENDIILWVSFIEWFSDSVWLAGFRNERRKGNKASWQSRKDMSKTPAMLSDMHPCWWSKFVHGHMEFDFKHESCIDPSKWFKWIWYDLIRPVQKDYQLAESSRNEVNLVQLQPQLLFPSAVGSPCAHGSEHESCLSVRQSVENYSIIWTTKHAINCRSLPS